MLLRKCQVNGSWKHDYPLSNALLDTPVSEFARAVLTQETKSGKNPDSGELTVQQLPKTIAGLLIGSQVLATGQYSPQCKSPKA